MRMTKDEVIDHLIEMTSLFEANKVNQISRLSITPNGDGSWTWVGDYKVEGQYTGNYTNLDHIGISVR